ncbi:ADC synthase [Lipomyces oligophaga]|uniref:ADC synthase n=1 Tax=Lipomyces oligophaga TaxID=45792 RepID=UPI0034CE2278
MKIILIDSQDSFTFNLVSLLKSLPCEPIVDVFSSSAIDPSILDPALYPAPYPALLAQYDLVLLGPGPGSPLNRLDMKGIPFFWRAIESLPLAVRPIVVGICLGFQYILVASGYTLDRLPTPRHGIVSSLDITPDGYKELYAGLESANVECVRYHSLYIDYSSSSPTSAFIPLAWSQERNELGKPVLMAAKSASSPYWVIQYHPESICSKFGLQTFENILFATDSHIKSRRLALRLTNFDERILSFIEKYKYQPSTVHPSIFTSREQRTLRQRVIQMDPSHDLSTFALSLCDKFERDFAFLDSASAPGSYSYIGYSSADSRRFSYSIPDSVMTISTASSTQEVPISCVADVWRYLADVMNIDIVFDKTLQISENQEKSSKQPTFFGGLVGYISYEAGVVGGLSLSVESESAAELPDFDLKFYERCLSFDFEQSVISLYSFESSDSSADQWMQQMQDLISKTPTTIDTALRDFEIDAGLISTPDEVLYKQTINAAQEYLASGDSYELCVTAQTTIQPRRYESSRENDWALYKKLRAVNPAPYGMFYYTAEACLVGMSPERFLKWDNNSRTCELRPIKGTVKNGGGVSYSDAVRLLGTPKERAENLMIVDLIRHDLSRFCGQVAVPQLMQVETYKSVYQLVSAIQGTEMFGSVSGADVLRGSLPPGSMTGAPKLRSVELLQDLESHNRRGIYSGVSGYWDILGHGDWSVVIRSAVRTRNNEWKIGAGGAITSLSNCHDEWTEMNIKLHTALQSFL